MQQVVCRVPSIAISATGSEQALRRIPGVHAIKPVFIVTSIADARAAAANAGGLINAARHEWRYRLLTPHSRCVALLLPLSLFALSGCTRSPQQRRGSADTAFAATQARGQAVMGVDQYTSAHVFEDLPDGGRIVLDRTDPRDSAGIATIRRHMRNIAAAFQAGDFSKPFQVHAQVVPGSAVMAARRNLIQYEAVDRPRGAEVRLHSSDAVAIAAIHEFLAFQRGSHHAAGHEGMPVGSH